MLSSFSFTNFWHRLCELREFESFTEFGWFEFSKWTRNSEELSSSSSFFLFWKTRSYLYQIYRIILYRRILTKKTLTFPNRMTSHICECIRSFIELLLTCYTYHNRFGSWYNACPLLLCVLLGSFSLRVPKFQLKIRVPLIPSVHATTPRCHGRACVSFQFIIACNTYTHFMYIRAGPHQSGCNAWDGTCSE